MLTIRCWALGVLLLTLSNTGQANACQFDPAQVDLFNVASNSLRPTIPRQVVAQYRQSAVDYLLAIPTNLLHWTAIAFNLENIAAAYASRPDAGKLIYFYVNDNHIPQGPMCNPQNLNSRCQDQSLADILPTLDLWDTGSPRLIVKIHVINNSQTLEEPISLLYQGSEELEPGQTFDQVLNEFIGLSKFHQCPDGGIGV